MKLDILKYLDGNPAMELVIQEGLDRVEKRISLTEVQKTCLIEFGMAIRPRVLELQKKQGKSPLNEEEAIELWELKACLDKIAAI